MSEKTARAVPKAAPATAPEPAPATAPEPAPEAAAAPYRGRRYRRHELALADGEHLVLRTDGVIEHRGADGATTRSWTPDDPEWPGQAIRFGIRPDPTTVKPEGHRGRGPNPPAF
jgi:hypothetical protein